MKEATDRIKEEKLHPKISRLEGKMSGWEMDDPIRGTTTGDFNINLLPSTTSTSYMANTIQ